MWRKGREDKQREDGQLKVEDRREAQAVAATSAPAGPDGEAPQHKAGHATAAELRAVEIRGDKSRYGSCSNQRCWRGEIHALIIPFCVGLG